MKLWVLMELRMTLLGGLKARLGSVFDSLEQAKAAVEKCQEQRWAAIEEVEVNQFPILHRKWWTLMNGEWSTLEET